MKKYMFMSRVRRGETVYRPGDVVDKLPKTLITDLINKEMLIEVDDNRSENPEEHPEPVAKGHLDKEQLATFSLQELEKLASDLGVSPDGKKEELIDRIAAVEVGYDPIDENETGKENE